MTATTGVAAVGDPQDARLATGASGLLHTFNAGGVVTAADVHVARRISGLVGEDDEQVQLAVAMAVRAVRNGAVCLDLAAVPGLAPDLAWPDPTRWRAAVRASPLLRECALREDQGLLYLDRYWQEETEVAGDLLARSASTAPAVDEATLQAALDYYFPGKAEEDQRAAAEAVCRCWTAVVTGGPGTGKTTTVARLLGVLLSLHDAQRPTGGALRVALAAPTGKAAARMAQAVREATHQDGFPGADGSPGDPDHDRMTVIREATASTLHRLLGSVPGNRTRFRHHRGNRLPHDVVVVDETSMVSLTMMARLLEAMRPEARLVLVGDADQLALVDAGAVLKDLVEGYGSAPESPVVRLIRTRRYGADIGALADAVRTGDPTGALAFLRDGGAEVEWLEEADLPALLRDRAVDLHAIALSGPPREALARLDQHRLLCAHREGPWGATEWNRRVERLLMSATGRDWLPEWYAGRPFVVNTNDYGLGLFNGDSGVACVHPDSPDGLVAVIDDETPEGRQLAPSRLADVSTAHAMTVHRGQGSQFDEVTVLLPEPDSRILTRELLYTAITRARSRVRVVGSEEAVVAAVTRRAQRATGLAGRLAR